MQDLSLISLILVSTLCTVCIFMGRQWLMRHEKYVQFISDATVSMGSRSLEAELTHLSREREALEHRHEQGKHRHKQLQSYLKDTQKSIAQFKVGLEPATFSAHDDEDLKSVINEVRKQQFHLISSGRAVVEQALQPEAQDLNAQLLLRSYNAECESLFRRLSIDNLPLMQSKLRQAQTQCNELAAPFGLAISDAYVHLKQQEMDLWHAAMVEREQGLPSATDGQDAGFIFVISNLGSFGKDTLALGYTFDHQPEKLIKTLGKEAVPYHYNIHTLAHVNHAASVFQALAETLASHAIGRTDQNPCFYRMSLQRMKQVLEANDIRSKWYFEVEPRDFVESQLQRQAGQVISTQRQASSILPNEI